MQSRETCFSAEEMHKSGMRWADKLQGNGVIALFGELGSGKTTFVKGIAEVAGVPACQVSSPTFNYLHIYQGSFPIYHFDLYRLRGPEDFFALGFDEYFSLGGICCIEWAERLGIMVPQNAVRLKLAHVGLHAHEREVVHVG